ncbi:HNH endonuclease family protein [Streptomyces sp. NPDC005925]|uniref:HNH endonuclease family protein n=1 Tax=Streptomyces sp. NPDC005925 TaxID=3157172 RepID=UPI0033E8EAAE
MRPDTHPRPCLRPCLRLRLRLRVGTAVLAASTALGLLVSGCEGLDGSDAPPGGHGPAAPGDGRTAGPLENPDGTKPGLAPVTTDTDRATARELIEGLRTKGRGPKTGYDRDEFGYAWMDTGDGVPLARNGCDTRNDLLRRDGRHLRFRTGSRCVVVAMTLDDPYTGTTVEWRKQQATDVQIDHVVPLSYSWQLGSARWPENRREQFANDPLNLIPVEGRANSAKSDSGPASWLPPDKRIRCAYAIRFTQVAVKYELPVTEPDKRTMLRQCGG